jgi:hypothetical protein
VLQNLKTAFRRVGEKNPYKPLWMLNVIPASSGTVHIYVTHVGEQWDYEHI